MKFRVEGTSRLTGEDVTLKLSAESISDAILLAEKEYSLSSVYASPFTRSNSSDNPKDAYSKTKLMNKNYGRTMGSRKTFLS